MGQQAIKIIHRVNTIPGLKQIPSEMGVEIDLRNYGKGIILHHNPFSKGPRFEDYCSAYNHKMIILNVKTQGIEDSILDIVKKYGITNYFLLDLPTPIIIKLTNQGEKNIALNFSDYEPIEACMKMRKKVKWVWVDWFKKISITKQNAQLLRRSFKLCISSPELQHHPKKAIPYYKNYLEAQSVKYQAVCTDYPQLWL